MHLNDLLTKHGISAQDVVVFRHRPTEPLFRKALPWLADEHPSLYNAYQQSHGPRVEKALPRARYVASFIGHEPGKALYVGLYEIASIGTLSRREYWALAEIIELSRLGMGGLRPDDPRSSIRWFDLSRTSFYEDWKGRMVVNWPGLERSWWRWADRNEFPVLSISEESLLVPPTVNWEQLVLSWAELQVLPRSLKASLAEWRGVYLIFDTSDGKGYVGSAYGAANILGRWLNYSASGHGGNKNLKMRSPDNFRFSILQRVSPDMPAEDVIRIEAGWKERLHTRHPLGLNDN